MYNEEENVVITLQKVNDVLYSLNTDYEILVVNDGSKDRTLDILKEQNSKNKKLRIVTYPKNKGLGAALKIGFERAKGDFVITIDSDLSYDAKYIAEIYNELNNANFDIIQGSPYMKGGQALNVPKFRLFVSKISNKFISYAISANVHTVTGMLRGYRKEVLDSLVLESNGPEIMVEILTKAALLGFKIKEIPAVLKGRERGKSKFQNQIRKIGAEYFSLLFAVKPIVFFKITGLFLVFLGFIYGLYLVSKYIRGLIETGHPVITNPIVILVILGALISFFSIIINQFTQIKKDLLIIQKQNKNIEKFLKEK